MVLVSDKPSNDTGILQTKFSYREGYEARRVGLEAMPLDEHIESGHGEREPRLKIGPAPMHHLFQVADRRYHQAARFPKHSAPPRTHFEIGRTGLRGMEAGVTQDNHAFFKLPNEPLKGVVRHIGGRTRP